MQTERKDRVSPAPGSFDIIHEETAIPRTVKRAGGREQQYERRSGLQ